MCIYPVLGIQAFSLSSGFSGNHEKCVEEEVERFANLSCVAAGSQNAQCCAEELTGKAAQCNFLLLFLFSFFIL